MIDQIILRKPDDWHLHLRDGGTLQSIITYSARVFSRAIVMPNLSPPITSVEGAKNYRKRILNSIPKGMFFQPLMTIYLREDLSPKVLEDGFKDGAFIAAKLYPANSTTNSSEGVRDIRNINSLLETMERINMPLLVHGEDIDPSIDIFDREAVFIERHLEPTLKRFPKLRVVLEHITTSEAVEFVQTSGFNLAATITPHHLHINRNAMFLGGFRSDFYCLPVVKRETHRLALRKAATSGKPCFFLGTDSAPHLRGSKESSCACAGIFNAPFAIESYTQVFEEEGALDRLQGFCSEFGPAFYGLPLNTNFIKLVRQKNPVPNIIPINNDGISVDSLVPFHAGEVLNWTLLND